MAKGKRASQSQKAAGHRNLAKARASRSIKRRLA